MPRDIQFVSVVDRLQVVEVTEVEGSVPRTVRIRGVRGFRSAQQLDINGVKVDDFTVVSDTVLLAVPGANLADTSVNEMAVPVISSQLTNTSKVQLLFGPTKRTKSIDGL